MESIRRNKLAILIFIMPALILFILVIVLPIIMSAYYSFIDWDGYNDKEFLGFKNYKELFTSKTAGFNKTTFNALLLVFLSVFIQLPFALFLAIILTSGIKGEKFFVYAFFIPVLLSTVVIGQLWLKIYNPEYGIINVFLNTLKLESLKRNWLGDQDTALLSVLVAIIWQFVGYHMLLMYSGIKAISPEINEAAEIEGATKWQISKYITIPLIKPILKICVIFAVTGSLKAFDLIYVLTNGGPAHASEVPSTLMVSIIFNRNRYGLGSSIAIFIIFLCFFFALLIQKLFKTEVE
jgi:raffinose/stachyose/melibiose transport system permease protein